MEKMGLFLQSGLKKQRRLKAFLSKGVYRAIVMKIINSFSKQAVNTYSRLSVSLDGGAIFCLSLVLLLNFTSFKGLA